MTVTYRWTDETQTKLLKIDGAVRTLFKAGIQGPSQEEYLEWVAEGNTAESAEGITWAKIRAKRDQILQDTDWTMTPGCTVDQAQWAAYRQNLRDLTSTYAETGPESVVWPVQPSTSGPNTIEE